MSFPPLTFFLIYIFYQNLLSNIPLKVSRCMSFVHIHSQHQGKLDRRSLKCIFVGYSSNQKGYKCYSPSTRKFYNSMDVTFVEHLPFFPNTPSQGGVTRTCTIGSLYLHLIFQPHKSPLLHLNLLFQPPRFFQPATFGCTLGDQDILRAPHKGRDTLRRSHSSLQH